MRRTNEEFNPFKGDWNFRDKTSDYETKETKKLENLVGPYVVVVWETNFDNKLSHYIDGFPTMRAAEKYAETIMKNTHYGRRTMTGWWYEAADLNDLLSESGKNKNENMNNRKLNHLMTYESFTTNEEFNPLKKEDWKKAGSSIRRGAGFTTPEEEMEEGKKIISGNPVKWGYYQELLKTDPKKAQKYLQFWGESVGGFTRDKNANPKWSEKEQKFVDVSRHFSPAGSIAAGN